MRIGKPGTSGARTRIVVVTPDPAFAEHARTTFGASPTIEVVIVAQALTDAHDSADVSQATVVIVDIDARQDADMAALTLLMQRIGPWPPVVAVTQVFDASVARTLVQMKIADFLVKPVSGLDLIEACTRVARAPTSQQNTEAQIFTFLPAVGGAGVTTLAIQTAMTLLNSGGHGKGALGKASTCLVDLDFQHGACADYLDIEPRLNLDEIEPNPERLDRQLLEVMLAHHPSGLAVIAAPNRPAEMRSFDPEVVTRLLDIVSTHFDYVIFDMPRTWFSWTDSVLHGSNMLYIVSEMTVPGLRHAKNLVDAIGERLGTELAPKVIINRFEQGLFTPGLRKSDIEQALGSSFATVIPNHYNLVREAIDRGVPLEEIKPGNKITAQVRKLVEAGLAKAKSGTTGEQDAARARAASAKPALLSRLKLAGSR